MLGHNETPIAVCICRIACERATTINIVINVAMQASLAALSLEYTYMYVEYVWLSTE